jgi:hypothetical protein
MSTVTLISSARAEWIKFRSVRSTMYGLITFFVLTIGLGALIDFAVENRYSHFSPERRLAFDPVAVSLAGFFFAQFVVGVIGALYITNEYTTSSIRVTLTAVPRRTLLVLSKVAVMVPSLLICSSLISFLAFEIGQVELHSTGRSVTLADPGVLRAVFLGGVYITLLGVLGFGLGLILRKTAAAIVVFVVVLLIVPILADVLPSDIGGPIMRFLPSELGRGMYSVNQASGVYPAWGCFFILLAYVTAVVAFGTYLLNMRDA